MLENIKERNEFGYNLDSSKFTSYRLDEEGVLIIEPIRLSVKHNGQFIMYQTIVIFQKEKKGSVEFQVFNFTNKIRRLTSHLELHKKDYLSQRGLKKILGKRQRLLAYLAKKNRVRYKELINQLDIRETKTR
ncbi:hypothetical protein H5410_057970 [Solanum commersonii]|uniref:30S ribosomal protein S15 n=1 Tax=Solanum commersonii TaxID=4109 RepID=A0A9J5WRR2_SOLCO|nr:hypothetical protein H5410_057970 [Solanum commersonii]